MCQPRLVQRTAFHITPPRLVALVSFSSSFPQCSWSLAGGGVNIDRRPFWGWALSLYSQHVDSDVPVLHCGRSVSG